MVALVVMKMHRPRVTRVSKNKYEIGIIGNRDPRGEDNYGY